VEKTKDGTLLLRLERSISYDTLNQIARAVFADYGIQSDYTLTLEDCGSGDVFLGSLWPGVIPNEPESAFPWLKTSEPRPPPLPGCSAGLGSCCCSPAGLPLLPR